MADLNSTISGDISMRLYQYDVSNWDNDEIVTILDEKTSDVIIPESVVISVIIDHSTEVDYEAMDVDRFLVIRQAGDVEGSFGVQNKLGVSIDAKINAYVAVQKVVTSKRGFESRHMSPYIPTTP